MSEEPLPLRIGPTAAGIVLAIAIVGLLMGSCGYALQRAALEGVGIMGLPIAWAMTAGCIYAANQQWIGRVPQERAERFVLCLVIALPVQLFVITAAVNVLEGLGGHL
jgi:hypothetical protein